MVDQITWTRKMLHNEDKRAFAQREREFRGRGTVVCESIPYFIAFFWFPSQKYITFGHYTIPVLLVSLP